MKLGMNNYIRARDTVSIGKLLYAHIKHIKQETKNNNDLSNLVKYFLVGIHIETTCNGVRKI